MDKFTLLGHNLTHSISPFIHRELFDIHKRDAEYTITDIEDIANFEPKKYRGFNVTIPYKKQIMSYIDNITNALESQSVNTVDNKDGVLYGYNTDISGFLGSIPKNLLKGHVLMYGFGGFGIMVANAVKKVGGHLTIVCREGKSSVEACLFTKSCDRHNAVTIEEFDKNPTIGANNSSRYNILINATPVGMYPNITECIVPEDVVKICDFIFDSIYNPTPTQLLKIASRYYLPNVGGIKMLVLQAAKSHEIWFEDKFNNTEIDNIVTKCEKHLLTNF